MYNDADGCNVIVSDGLCRFCFVVRVQAHAQEELGADIVLTG